MDLGPHFSNAPCVKKFKVTNMGRRLQQLVWTTDGFPLVKPRKDPLYDARDVRYKVGNSIYHLPAKHMSSVLSQPSLWTN